MSPEEQQVVYDQWYNLLDAALMDLRQGAQECTHDASTDIMDDAANVLSKVCIDIAKLMWDDKDRNAARTIVAGYVSQSNTERQARRDADLERHKRMVEEAADKRARQKIIEGVDHAVKARAQAERERDDAIRKSALEHNEYEAKLAKWKMEIDNYRAELEKDFEARVEAAVQERLSGPPESATPGRRKRPLIVGD